jgi:ferritin
MISKKLEKAINAQINRELYSSYLYLAMANAAESMVLKGSAAWFKIQASEENGHAMKFYAYLHEQGAKVELEAIAKPPADFSSMQAMFDQTLKHERQVTKFIRELMVLADSEKDYASLGLIQWFVNEQVEEEANVVEILAQLKMIGGSTGGLYMLDRQLGKRAAG